MKGQGRTKDMEGQRRAIKNMKGYERAAKGKKECKS